MRSLLLETDRLVSVLLLSFIVLTANQTGFSQYVCPVTGSPEIRSGSIAAGDLTQNARINRDGTPSSCTGGAPTAAPIAGTFRFDSYSFTNPNPVEACVSVDYNMTGCGAANSTQVNAYSTFDPAAPNTNVIGEPGFSTVGTGRLQFRVTANQNFVIVVHEVAANAGCVAYTFTLTYRTGCRQAGFDTGNNGRADAAMFRPSDGTWQIADLVNPPTVKSFGLNGDVITPGDYTGDNQTDLSTYRPSTNTWFYSTSQSSPQNNVTYQPWGVAGDIPIPGDYDKDSKTDIAVWRPSDGTWYILRSSNSTVQFQKWGQNGDTPITGDYDGDLAADFGVVRPNGGQYQWLLMNSNFGYGFYYGCGTTAPTCAVGVNFGLTTDRPVVGDFDGDARTDIAVFRPSDGSWHYLRSSLGAANAPGATSQTLFNFGLTGDIPQPADFDGDKQTDFAIFRPSESRWWIHNSNTLTFTTFTLGAGTDQPATSPYRISNP